jgi:hypothetical protein
LLLQLQTVSVLCVSLPNSEPIKSPEPRGGEHTDVSHNRMSRFCERKEGLCSDGGIKSFEALGLGGGTAFTDKFPDVGKADLGYHGTLLRPVEGTLTIGDTTLTFNPSGDSFSLSGSLQPGEDSDEMEPGVEYVEVTLANARLFLPAGDSRVVINRLSDGSVNFTVNGNLDFGLIEHDFGSTVVTMRGTLQFP